MANLNFKWGNHANLPAQLSADQVGSLFFTKDEGALYLGVEANKAPRRIQGVVQYYATLAAFKANVLPPYSEDVIYYIASENALVKWHGEKVSADGTIKEEGKFTILNVTASEFEAKVSDLASDISTNAGNIGTNTTNIAGLRTDLGNSNDTADKETAFGRIADLEAAVEALEELTGTGSGDNSLSARIGTLETWKTTASGQITTLEGDVSTLQGDVSTAKTDITNLRTATETNATNIGANATAITNLQNTDNGILTRLGAAETDIDNAEKNIGQNAADIADLQGTVGGHTTSIGNLTSSLNEASGKITALETLTGTHTTNIGKNADDIAALALRVGANEASIEELDGDLTDVSAVASGAAAALGTKDDTADKDTAFGKIAALAAEDVLIKDAATKLTARVKANEDKLIEHNTAIGNLQSFQESATGDISNLQSEIAKKADSSTVTTLSGRVDTIVSENATRDQNITNNANGISAINDKIGGEFSATNTVAKAIADVAGDVAENQGKIGTNTEDIADLKELTAGHSEAIEGIGVEISGIKEADATRDGKISALEIWKTTAAQKIEDLEGDVSAAQADATSALNKFADYYTKTEADGKHTDLKNSLETKLANEINAANSLTYIKGIGSDSEWNAVKVADTAIGHTYVVTESNIYLDINGTSTVCNAGDLLIATAATGKTETNGVLAAADTVWVHVKSGYQEELQSQLRVVDGDADATKKASIQLTSYPAAQAGNYGDKGIVNIVADSNNLEVTVNNQDVKIAMVWDTF